MSLIEIRHWPYYSHRYVLNLITDATDEPATISEIKDQLRIDGTDSDALLQAYIMAARKALENEINRPIGEQTFEYKFQFWPACAIHLPRLPFQSLVSIKYTLEDGTVNTLYDTESSPAAENSAIYVENGDDYVPGTVRLYVGESWPTDTLRKGYPIAIKFTAGLTTIDEDLRLAHLMTVGHFYEHRESVSEDSMSEIPMGAKWLLERHRYITF